MLNKKYKLKKCFPGSPPTDTIVKQRTIGYQSDGGFGSFFNEDIENYPEFWEEIKEKEWKIIEFTADIELPIPAIFDWCIWRDLLKIKSIIRKTDNTIFSIGDKIKMIGHANDKSPEQITKIELNKEGIPCLFTNTFHNNGINIMKAIKSEKLFTTEDKVDIFKGDLYFYVDDCFDIVGVRAGITSGTNGFKYFSTEKAAKDWIDLNKPMYSKKDLLNASINMQYGEWFIGGLIKRINK